MMFFFGLGNPGAEYALTRHNVGFMVVEAVAAKLGLDWRSLKKAQAMEAGNTRVKLFKPLTFMNQVGESVRLALDFYQTKSGRGRPAPFENVWIIHDDLDLRLGQYKIQLGRGPHDHRGLHSVYTQLKSKRFWHVRMGVDNRGLERLIPGEQYVLQKFSPQEKRALDSMIKLVVDELLTTKK